MRSAVAGTFNVLHSGHRAMIDRAFEVGDEVFVGITSDEMASSTRVRLNPLYLRRKALEAYLRTKDAPWRLFVIDDMYGPAEMMRDVGVLVVSEDTLENGEEVNRRRAEEGLEPLELSVVGMVLDSAERKVSSTNVIYGICSRDGERDAVSVSVGSLNPAKVEAVRAVMERIYGQVRVRGEDVPSCVPEQPMGDETAQGAENRARACIGKSDLGVGIEAGVFETRDGLYDVQWCAVVDRGGRMTYGTGPGFRYPDEVADLVRRGRTVGEAMEIACSGDRGEAEGAVGVLSRGLIDRKELTEQSVMAAMLPRIWEGR